MENKNHKKYLVTKKIKNIKIPFLLNWQKIKLNKN